MASYCSTVDTRKSHLPVSSQDRMAALTRIKGHIDHEAAASRCGCHVPASRDRVPIADAAASAAEINTSTPKSRNRSRTRRIGLCGSPRTADSAGMALPPRRQFSRQANLRIHLRVQGRGFRRMQVRVVNRET